NARTELRPYPVYQPDIAFFPCVDTAAEYLPGKDVVFLYMERLRQEWLKFPVDPDCYASGRNGEFIQGDDHFFFSTGRV
ncbi:MAG: hypothetical protein J6A21_03100, partial [Lentisphaeria bacterium]|nr:hypothetical protein [Lentisphaeria bacterium]